MILSIGGGRLLLSREERGHLRLLLNREELVCIFSIEGRERDAFSMEGRERCLLYKEEAGSFSVKRRERERERESLSSQ